MLPDSYAGPMSEVRLAGHLLCATQEESTLVAEHLPTHMALTLAEPGCLAFAVDRTSDPLIWAVAERFTDTAAFKAHQARIAASEWGRATAGIERRYRSMG